MSFERIAGLLFSGFMCKIYAAGLGVWAACEAGHVIATTFGAINKGFGL